MLNIVSPFIQVAVHTTNGIKNNLADIAAHYPRVAKVAKYAGSFFAVLSFAIIIISGFPHAMSVMHLSSLFAGTKYSGPLLSALLSGAGAVSLGAIEGEKALAKRTLNQIEIATISETGGE